MLNDILTLDQQWLSNRSDFPQVSWPWYRAWPSPNYEWFPWSICNGCDMPAGNAYPSGHLLPSPFFGLACAPIVWDQIPLTCHVCTRLFILNTPMYFLDFAFFYFLLKYATGICNYFFDIPHVHVTSISQVGLHHFIIIFGPYLTNSIICRKMNTSVTK